MRLVVPTVKMYDDVVIPQYQTEGSAGCDVRAYLKNMEEMDGLKDDKLVLRIFPGMTGVMIPTGLKMSIPIGYYMAVVPRSGLSVKTKMRISNSPGTVDCDFRNEVKIIIDNISYNEVVTINHQDRIAQFIFLPYFQADFPTPYEDLDKTSRQGGFGSTGIA